MNILFCIIICVFTICVTIFLNKRTSANLYKEMVLDANKPDSPYSVSRECGDSGDWGYCITKDGEIMYSNGKSRIFDSVAQALKEINTLEAVQGYKKTRV